GGADRRGPREVRLRVGLAPGPPAQRGGAPRRAQGPGGRGGAAGDLRAGGGLLRRGRGRAAGDGRAPGDDRPAQPHRRGHALGQPGPSAEAGHRRRAGGALAAAERLPGLLRQPGRGHAHAAAEPRQQLRR
ncbi:unnamed protein product, partial [Heterosigma akashiwo]